MANLDSSPPMDKLRIGPGGQTFGQLKRDVRATREAYVSCPCPHHLEALSASQDMLKAAYAKVGLPYVAP